MLAELPQDLLFTIFDLLRPFDIISAGKTCKALCYASDQHTVWTAALKRMCVLNKVYFPSFTPDAMSVQELKNAATAPTRMLALLSSGKMSRDLIVGSIQPRKIRLNQISTIVGKPVLVPGGRFLVVTGRRASGGSGVDLLGVWDLHTPSDHSDPIALEQLSQSYPARCMVAVAPAPRRDAFRIALTGKFDYRKPERVSSSNCVVYEFSPSSPTSPLTCLNSSTDRLPNGDYINPTLNGDIFANTAWPFSSDIRLWNFVEDTWAGWAMPEHHHGEIFLNDRYVIFLSYKSAMGWELPQFLPWDLYRSASESNPPPPPLPPAFVIPLEGNLREPSATITRRRNILWYHDIPNLNIKVEFGRGSFQLTFPSADRECTVTSTLIVKHEAVPKDSLMDSFVLNDRVVRCWVHLDRNMPSEPHFTVALDQREPMTEPNTPGSQNTAIAATSPIQPVQYLDFPWELSKSRARMSGRGHGGAIRDPEYLAYDMAFGRFCFGMPVDGQIGTPEITVYDLLDK